MTVSDPSAPNTTASNVSAEEISLKEVTLTGDYQAAEVEVNKEGARAAPVPQPPLRKIIVCPDEPIGGEYKCYEITLPS